MKHQIPANPANIISFNKAKAQKVFQEAYEMQINGFVDAAIDLYVRSIDLYPTAKAYTFLAWAHASRREFELAIEFCKIAIEIDPDYGNPYNDAGAYLIELDRPLEARPYLEKAIQAKNYEYRFYPYYNLGKLYLMNKDYEKAHRCFEKAVDLKPEFQAAHDELEHLGNHPTVS